MNLENIKKMAFFEMRERLNLEGFDSSDIRNICSFMHESNIIPVRQRSDLNLYTLSFNGKRVGLGRVRKNSFFFSFGTSGDCSDLEVNKLICKLSFRLDSDEEISLFINDADYRNKSLIREPIRFSSDYLRMPYIRNNVPVIGELTYLAKYEFKKYGQEQKIAMLEGRFENVSLKVRDRQGVRF